MRSFLFVLTVSAALVAPTMTGCGGSSTDGEVDVEASDTGTTPAPANDADNP